LPSGRAADGVMGLLRRDTSGVGLAFGALVGGIGGAAALGGDWSGVTQLRLHWRALVVAAVVAQGGGALVGVAGIADARRSYVVGLAVSAACAAVFCARNVRVAGVPLLTLGLVSNALVVGLNGAM